MSDTPTSMNTLDGFAVSSLSSRARTAWHAGSTQAALTWWMKAFDLDPSMWWNALESLRILRAQVDAVPVGPRLLLFSPHYATNAYQGNLYSAAERYGFSVRPVDDLQLDPQLARASLTSGSVFHQHWLKELYWRAPNLVSGRYAIDKHVALLKTLKSFGVKVCWTLHNLIDHDPNNTQRQTCDYAIQEMARVSDQIFVHSKSAADALSAHCGLDWSFKCIKLEHPLYTNIANLTTQNLPAELDLRKIGGRRVLLCLGMIRPYKGVPELLTAFSEVIQNEEGSNLHLIIAGRLVDSQVSPLIKKLPEAIAEKISYIPRELTEAELAGLSRIGNISVTPYRNILTSGSYYLSTSFALPTLAPNLGMFSEMVIDDDNGFLYDGTIEGLVNGIRRIAGMDPYRLSLVGARALEINSHLTPEAVSDRFFSAL